MSSLAALLSLLAVEPTQDWDVCFLPGTSIVTSAGHQAVAQAASDLAHTGAFGALLILKPSHDAAELAANRVFEVRWELANAGVSLGRIRTEISYPTLDDDCLSVRLLSGGGPGLWHLWGPYFSAGVAEISPAQKKGLRLLTAGYRSGETVYRIRGHTDTAGEENINLNLGLARADSVRRELVRLGVRWTDIEVTSAGEAELARGTADGVSEPLNRRVQIDVRRRPATPR